MVGIQSTAVQMCACVDALIALTRVFAEVCLGWGWLAGIPVLVAYPRLVTAC